MDWRKMCVITRQDAGLQCKTHGIGENWYENEHQKTQGNRLHRCQISKVLLYFDSSYEE